MLKHFRVKGHDICNSGLHHSAKKLVEYSYTYIYILYRKDKANVAKMLVINNLGKVQVFIVLHL